MLSEDKVQGWEYTHAWDPKRVQADWVVDHRRPRDYPGGTDHGSHERGVRPFHKQSEQRRPSLQVLLRGLRGHVFSRPVHQMVLGKELEFLRKEPIVEKLASAMRGPDTAIVVDELLDELFNDLLPGQIFIHTETVMVILIALSVANGAAFRSVTQAFAESKGIEVAHLRHFAQKLLK